MRSATRPAILLAAGLLAAAVLPSAALAQTPGEAGAHRLAAPVPKKADTNPPALWNYFTLIIIVGAVFTANLIPSKRGHQD